MPGLASKRDTQLRVLAFPGLDARGGNPYTWLLYSNMACQVDEFTLRRACFGGRYDILHLHWPEVELNGCSSAIKAFLRLRRRLFAIDRMRARGTKVFWTVHNLGSHERRYPFLERWFWRELIRRLDGYIALTESGKTEALKYFPALHKFPGFVVPHGHYRGEYPMDPAIDARAMLKLPASAKVLLFFGRIRPYKNLSALIEVFRQTDDQEAVLYIVGPPHDLALSQELSTLAAGDSRIRIESSHIPAAQAHLYFSAADLVVLPYRDILNSGAAMLALSFNRRILVPNRGAMKELYIQVGADWVRTFDELTADELSAAVEWGLGAPHSAMAPLEHLDWGVLAARTLDAYERVISRSPAECSKS